MARKTKRPEPVAPMARRVITGVKTEETQPLKARPVSEVKLKKGNAFQRAEARRDARKLAKADRLKKEAGNYDKAPLKTYDPEKADRLKSKAGKLESKAAKKGLLGKVGDAIEKRQLKKADRLAKKDDSPAPAPKKTAGPTKEGRASTEAVAKANAESNSSAAAKPAPAQAAPAASSPKITLETKSEVDPGARASYIKEKALRTVRGDYKTGAERKKILGDDYAEVQAEVNKMKKAGKFSGGGMMKKYAKGGKVKNSSSVNSDPELRKKVKSKFGPPASGKADPFYPELAVVNFPRKKNGVSAGLKAAMDIPSEMRPRQEKTPPGSSRPIPSSPRKKQSPKVEAKNDSASKLNTYESIRDNYFSRREKKETTNFSYMGGGSLKGLIGKKKK